MSEKIEFEGRAIKETLLGQHGMNQRDTITWTRAMMVLPEGVKHGERYHVTLTPVEPELLPCPFCGGEAHYWEADGFEGAPAWRVACRNCGAATALSGEAFVRDLWNRRAE